MRKKVLVFTILLISIYFVSALALTPTSFLSEVYNVSFYNITINNTNSGQEANITQIDITIPGTFTFINGSNGTSAPFESFSNTSTVLTWINSTGYLINGSDLNYFWFNANSSALGDLAFTITGTNATGTFSDTISIQVRDQTPPLVSFEDPTPIDNSQLSRNYFTVNVTASDNFDIDTITINISDGTSVIKTQTSTSSPFSYNFTGLSNGTYEIDATVYDSSGNTDSTTSREITIGTITIAPCTQNWSCTEWSNNCSLEEVEKERTCTDTNNCGNSTGKPYEIWICAEEPACTPSWQCGNWTPLECPEEQTQTRICTDTNNCGNSTGKPEETQTCVYEKSSNTTFILIVGGIVIGMGSITTFIVFLLKKKGAEAIVGAASTVQTAGVPPPPPPFPPTQPGIPPGTKPPPPSKPL